MAASVFPFFGDGRMSFDEPYPEWQTAGGESNQEGRKLFRAVGVVCALLLVLSCGGLFAVGYVFKNWYTASLSTKPDEVKALAAEIAEFDIPSGLVPKACTRLRVPVIGSTVLNWSLFEDESSHSILVLAHRPSWDTNLPQVVRQSLEQSLRQQDFDPDPERLLNANSLVKGAQVRNAMAPVIVTTGQGSQSKTERLQLFCTFQGRTGPAALLVLTDAKKYPEDMLLTLIESIH